MNATAHVYGLWDRHDRLLYVGMTSGLTTRMESHRSTKPWWPEVAAIMASEEMPRTEAEKVERTEILQSQPLYNVADKDGRPAWQMAQDAGAESLRRWYTHQRETLKPRP